MQKGQDALDSMNNGMKRAARRVTPPIDKDKLRAKLRKMDDAQVYALLDRAIELLSPTKLRKLVETYITLEDLKPYSDTVDDLLRTVTGFQRRSLSGEYYQSFMVNSKNCTEMSKGTRAWITDCNRLLESCISAVPKGDIKQASAAFEILFNLLSEIDRDPDAIVFFADEGGSWQVGCDWRKILPAWFKCLSSIASPDAYAEKVVHIIDGFVRYDRDRFLTSARRATTAEQRKALNAAACR